MTTINSKRLFTVAYLEANFTYSNPGLNLEQVYLNDEELEWKYAIQENIDKVLDLKVDERLVMNFNRDNSDSAGFIKRIR